MFLIVGLGNPGAEYAGTRHNVGFAAADAVAEKYAFAPFRDKFDGQIAEGKIAGEKVFLLKPQTYMNLSGESVVQLCNWYKPEYDQLIVLFDDCDLPEGKVRFRAEGSAGTHNGMRNIIYLLGRTDFPRIRVGIGRPPEGWELCDFVLTRPTGDEDRKLMNEGYEKAAQAVEIYLKDGLDAVRTFVGR